MSESRRKISSRVLKVVVTPPVVAPYEELSSPSQTPEVCSPSLSSRSMNSEGDSDSKSDHDTLQIPYQGLDGSPEMDKQRSKEVTRSSVHAINSLSIKQKRQNRCLNNSDLVKLAALQISKDTLELLDNKTLIQWMELRLLEIADAIGGQDHLINRILDLLSEDVCSALFLSQGHKQKSEGARLAASIFMISPGGALDSSYPVLQDGFIEYNKLARIKCNLGKIKEKLYDYLQTTPDAQPILQQVLQILRLKWLEIEKYLDLPVNLQSKVIAKKAKIFEQVECMWKYALPEEIVSKKTLFKAIGRCPEYFLAIFKKNPAALEHISISNKTDVVSCLHQVHSYLEVEEKNIVKSNHIPLLCELQVRILAGLLNPELQLDSSTFLLHDKLELAGLTSFEKEMIAKSVFILATLLNDKNRVND